MTKKIELKINGNLIIKFMYVESRVRSWQNQNFT